MTRCLEKEDEIYEEMRTTKNEIEEGPWQTTVQFWPLLHRKDVRSHAANPVQFIKHDVESMIGGISVGRNGRREEAMVLAGQATAAELQLSPAQVNTVNWAIAPTFEKNKSNAKYASASGKQICESKKRRREVFYSTTAETSCHSCSFTPPRRSSNQK